MVATQRVIVITQWVMAPTSTGNADYPAGNHCYPAGKANYRVLFWLRCGVALNHKSLCTRDMALLKTETPKLWRLTADFLPALCSALNTPCALPLCGPVGSKQIERIIISERFEGDLAHIFCLC